MRGRDPQTRHYWGIPTIVFLSSLCLYGQAAAEQLALFNFNDMAGRSDGTSAVTAHNAQGTPKITLAGESYQDNNGQKGTGYQDSTGVSHPAGQAAAWGSGVNDTSPANTFTLLLDTIGFEDLSVRIDYRSSPTGPGGLKFECRTRGAGPYREIGTKPLIQGKEFQKLRWDLSDIPGIQDTRGVELRWTWTADGTGVGTARVDNIELIAAKRAH